MNKIETTEAKHIGSIISNLVEQIDPKEYAKYQLRQAIQGAREQVGDDKVREIINEEITA